MRSPLAVTRRLRPGVLVEGINAVVLVVAELCGRSGFSGGGGRRGVWSPRPAVMLTPSVVRFSSRFVVVVVVVGFGSSTSSPAAAGLGRCRRVGVVVAVAVTVFLVAAVRASGIWLRGGVRLRGCVLRCFGGRLLCVDASVRLLLLLLLAT